MRDRGEMRAGRFENGGGEGAGMDDGERRRRESLLGESDEGRLDIIRTARLCRMADENGVDGVERC